MTIETYIKRLSLDEVTALINATHRSVVENKRLAAEAHREARRFEKEIERRIAKTTKEKT